MAVLQVARQCGPASTKGSPLRNTAAKLILACEQMQLPLKTSTSSLNCLFAAIEQMVFSYSMNMSHAPLDGCNHEVAHKGAKVVQAIQKRARRQVQGQAKNSLLDHAAWSKYSSPCLPNPCQNGFECGVNNNDDGYYCNCGQQYFGRHCELTYEDCTAGTTTLGGWTFYFREMKHEETMSGSCAELTGIADLQGPDEGVELKCGHGEVSLARG